MITALAIVFVFGLLVLVHEFGHYMLARLNGIRVLEFAFGFGPKLIGFKGKETDYSIRLIPLGGYVRMHGMDTEVNDKGETILAPPTDPRSFQNKKIWQRMSVIAAGPLMNFVLAIVLFALVFAFYGIPTSANTNTIGSILEGNPAHAAGLQPGDKIISVDGVPTPDWNTLTQNIHSKPNQEVTLVVEQNGVQRALTIKTILDPQTGNGLLGIIPEVIYERVSVMESVRYGLEQTVNFTRLLVVTIAQMITGEVEADVGGPVAIAQVIGEGARQGWSSLLSLTGVLSLQLGLLNLFPIPALDGSHLVFLAIEGLRGKPINQERQGFINLIGFAFLIALMLAVTYKDIMRLFSNS